MVGRFWKRAVEPMRIWLAMITLVASLLPAGSPAFAANGDNLRLIIGASSRPCSINTGLAFDGTNLLVTCWGNNVIDVLSPADGHLVRTVPVPGYTGLMAAAWDQSRHMLWVCAEHQNVILVDTTTGASTPKFKAPACTDGLAYDGVDDTIWLSPDVSSTVYHYKADGTLIAGFPVGGLLGGAGNSGIAVGGDKLYLANNGYSQIYEVAKDFSGSSLFASFPARLEDLECDDITFAAQGVGAIWSIDAYDRRINAWEIPAGKCGFGGKPPEPQINPTVTAYSGDQTGDYHDSVMLSAALTNPDGGSQPGAGLTIDFTLGAQTVSGVTDATGTAAVSLLLNQPSGVYPLEASFAGNKDWKASKADARFTITREETTLTLAGDTMVSFGEMAHYTATLLEDGTSPIAGRTVTFTVGSMSATGTTDANGTVSASFQMLSDPGSYAVNAKFGGDDYYLPDVAKGVTLQVFNTPGKVTAGTLSVDDAGGRRTGGFVIMYAAGDAAPSGEFQYQDRAAGLKVHASGYSGLGVSADKQSAWFSGPADVNWVSGYHMIVYVQDNGEPGRNDVFNIWITGPNGFAYKAGGTLTGGNIQIH